MLPTYNERENVAALLAAVRRALPDADVLVVDDNSPDGTASARRGGGGRAGPDQAAAPPRQAGPRQRLPAAGSPSPSTRATTWSCRWTSTSPTTRPCSRRCSRLIDAGADAVIGSRYVPGGATVDWPRAPPAAVAVGQPLHVAACSACRSATARRAFAPTARRRCGRSTRRRPRPRATRSSPSSCAGWCAPATGWWRPRSCSPTGARAVEDVGADHRRVDAARHPLGHPRRLRRGAATPALTARPRPTADTLAGRASSGRCSPAPRTPSRQPIFLPSS